MEFCKFF
jgi:phospholipid-transporting ATPase